MPAFSDAAGRRRRERSAKQWSLLASLCAHGLVALFVVVWKPPVLPSAVRGAAVTLVAAGASHETAAHAGAADEGSSPRPSKRRAQAGQGVTIKPSNPPPPGRTPAPMDAPSPAFAAAQDRTPTPTPSSVLLNPASARVRTLAQSGPDPTATPLNVRAVSSPETPAAAGVSADPSCRILEGLQARLAASLEIRARLALIPKRSLSVSDAILLWNGQWIDETSVGGAAVLGPIERAVGVAVAQSPISCRNAVVHGPRLVTLSDAGDTKVLAFGSGDWRWADAASGIAVENVK